ncbi:MAG: thymidine phosphorylase [Actinomycetota bacterium]|nr:thymidine phosphorylase [Actinomycetota bacterium]
MISYELIAKKRDGGRHDRQELEFLIDGFVSGRITDPQMAAWLMAAYLRGLDSRETAYLTEAMVASGKTVDLSGVDGEPVDKHSTGGVGDKATLVVVPLAAAAGVTVPKLSGRALGHTGGTLDKLESISGFRAGLSVAEFVGQLKSVGAAIAAQTADLVPADKKIYALRDQTATVASIPLIAASIISKKAAGGAKNILIDVKTGSGAFMPTLAESRELAAVLTEVGDGLGLKVRCLITDMSRPLGRAVGNALEVKEAIDCLTGGGPADLRELSVRLAALMVEMAGLVADPDGAVRLVTKCLDSGQGAQKFKEMIAAQGGDSRVVDSPDLLSVAPGRRVIAAESDGWLNIADCGRLGLASAVLAGGHLGEKGQIDRSAGLVMLAKLGDPVKTGDPLIELYYSDKDRLEAAGAAIAEAIGVVSARPEVRPLIRE